MKVGLKTYGQRLSYFLHMNVHSHHKIPFFSKQEKKQTTISSLYNLTFDRALALLLPLKKEMFLSFPKHSHPEGLKKTLVTFQNK